MTSEADIQRSHRSARGRGQKWASYGDDKTTCRFSAGAPSLKSLSTFAVRISNTSRPPPFNCLAPTKRRTSLGDMLKVLGTLVNTHAKLPTCRANIVQDGALPSRPRTFHSMSIVIDHRQMRCMQASWFARIEADVIAALHARFSEPDESGAAQFHAVATDDLARYVHHIVELGVRHDFRLLDDLLALVNACIDLGAKRFLSIPVLSQSALMPQEKIAVMRELCALGLAPVAPGGLDG